MNAFSKFFSISSRGNRVNEDFAFAAGDFGVLLDGASGLSGERLIDDPACGSDAQWFSHTMGEDLAARLAGGVPAAEALEGAVARARETLLAQHPGEDRSELLDRAPSATLLMAAVTGDMLELVSLGDSRLVVIKRDGTSFELYDNSVSLLDQGVVSAMTVASRGRNLSAAQKRALVNDQVKANRDKKNTPGGYWILDPSGAGLGHALAASIPLAEVDCVCGMSDGFCAAFDCYGLADQADFLRTATETSAQDLIDKMRAAENADSDLDRYPRLKNPTTTQSSSCGGKAPTGLNILVYARINAIPT